MILLRIGIIVLFLAVLLGASNLIASWLPCPDPNPPAGLTADFYATWSFVIFGSCAVYVLIPFSSFQFWASALPVGLIVIFVYAFSQTGAFDHAIYLLIEGIFAIGLALFFKLIAEGIIAVMKTEGFMIRAVALLGAYFASAGWARVQALGFSASLC